MLRFNFTRIFKSRGIDKPFSYLVKQGYSDNFSTRIVNNRLEKLNLKDLERLCELLHCTPNDLMEWTSENTTDIKKQHPLKPLERTNKVVDLTKILHSVPVDRLTEIETLINERIKT